VKLIKNQAAKKLELDWRSIAASYDVVDWM